MSIHRANALLERLGISHRVKPTDRQDEFWLLVIGDLADRILALEAARPTAPATGAAEGRGPMLATKGRAADAYEPRATRPTTPSTGEGE